MTEIRLHGLGGQGIVTAAEIIAIAAHHQGHQAQSFPFFGPERTGQPLQAFVRIASQRIRTREQVYHPDWLIIREAKLLAHPSIAAGFKKNASILINSSKTPDEIIAELPEPIKKLKPHLFTVDASGAAKELGSEVLANTYLLAVFGQLSKLFGPTELAKAIKEKFADKSAAIIDINLKTASAAIKQ